MFVSAFSQTTLLFHCMGISYNQCLLAVSVTGLLDPCSVSTTGHTSLPVSSVLDPTYSFVICSLILIQCTVQPHSKKEYIFWFLTSENVSLFHATESGRVSKRLHVTLHSFIPSHSIPFLCCWKVRRHTDSGSIYCPHHSPNTESLWILILISDTQKHPILWTSLIPTHAFYWILGGPF